MFSPPSSREEFCAVHGELDRDRNSALNMKAIFVDMFQGGGDRPAYLNKSATRAAVAERTSAAKADDVVDGAAFRGAAGVCCVCVLA